ncbi:MAG: VOC family protein [Legionellaceae bacterium]|nr:VOC family protein [Legionellaceae bacterium]
MAIQFNHTIIAARDRKLSAAFLAEVLGLPTPTSFGPFMVVKTQNDVNLDFMSTTKEIQPKHYAFLVSEAEFDEIFERVLNKKLTYWADHKRELPGKINHNDGGRGFYFTDPNGHFLEILTRPYGDSD